MEDQNQQAGEDAGTAEGMAEAVAHSEGTPPSDNATIENLKALCAENLAGWQRALADYANLKRESEKGASEIGKYASAGVVAALLPIFDGFAKAHAARPKDPSQLPQWADGIGHIKSQMDAALAKLGLQVIDETTVDFDAEQHEAMLMEKAPGDHVRSGTILRVLEPGYKMNGRILRPAKVVVAE